MTRRPLDSWKTDTIAFPPATRGASSMRAPVPCGVTPTERNPAVAAQAVAPPPAGLVVVLTPEVGAGVAEGVGVGVGVAATVAGHGSTVAVLPRSTNTAWDFKTLPSRSQVSV